MLAVPPPAAEHGAGRLEQVRGQACPELGCRGGSRHWVKPPGRHHLGCPRGSGVTAGNHAGLQPEPWGKWDRMLSGGHARGLGAFGLGFAHWCVLISVIAAFTLGSAAVFQW